MICRHCSKEIPDESKFCNLCGKNQTVKRTAKRTRANGMGTVFKRGNKWYAKATTGWKENEEGQRLPVRPTKGGFHTKTEALEYLTTLKKAKPALKKKPTFLEVYEAWEVQHSEKVEKVTMGCYHAAKNYYRSIYHMRFEDICLDELQACIEECPKGRRTRENMKALGTLLYKYALPRHLSDMDYATFIYLGNNDKTKRMPFTMEEVEVVRQHVGKVPFADYIYCLMYTGFRPNEMLQLTRDDYDPVECTLTGGFKTEAGTNRVVPISPKIADIIRKQAIKASPYLFPRNGNERMYDRYFRERCFYPALAKMGLQPVPKPFETPRLMPYSCRHTFSDLLKQVPGSPTEKAGLMGHTSYEMTQEYQTPDLTLKRAIMDQI